LHVAFTVVTFICITNSTTAPMLISGTTELAAVQLVLKFLGGCWWEPISCHSQRPVYSFDFCFTV